MGAHSFCVMCLRHVRRASCPVLRSARRHVLATLHGTWLSTPHAVGWASDACDSAGTLLTGRLCAQPMHTRTSGLVRHNCEGSSGRPRLPLVRAGGDCRKGHCGRGGRVGLSRIRVGHAQARQVAQDVPAIPLPGTQALADGEDNPAFRQHHTLSQPLSMRTTNSKQHPRDGSACCGCAAALRRASQEHGPSQPASDCTLGSAGTPHLPSPRKHQHRTPQHAARRGGARVDVKFAARILRGQQRADAAAPASHAHGERALHLRRGGLRDERVGVRAAQVLVAGAGGCKAVAAPVLRSQSACQFKRGAVTAARPARSAATALAALLKMSGVSRPLPRGACPDGLGCTADRWRSALGGSQRNRACSTRRPERALRSDGTASVRHKQPAHLQRQPRPAARRPPRRARPGLARPGRRRLRRRSRRRRRRAARHRRLKAGRRRPHQSRLQGSAALSGLLFRVCQQAHAHP